ncbi:FliM/FliN family flagellar motor switch protein [Hyphococcus lacteus]|uniref:Flagellar motor switch protein FliN n=1 Tax=Hyphococcus lacteus TaxID=3143536 RepID=A0ABV3Z798_9PROT
MSNESDIVSEDTDAGTVVADMLSGDGATKNKNILELPVRIVVSVGAAQMTVQQLLELKKETVVDLEAMIDDPVDIFVGERLIARGELVEATDNENGIGVKLVEICGLGN